MMQRWTEMNYSSSRSLLGSIVIMAIILTGMSGCSHFMTSPKPLAESKLALPDDKDRWWACFHDPLMDALADKLLKQNLDIKMAQARLDEVRGLYRNTVGNMLPQINARAYFDRGNQQVMAQGPYWIANTGLSATWELDVFGSRRGQMSAADAVVLSRVYGLHYAAQLVLAELFQSVVSWRQAQKLLLETEHLLHAQNDQVQLFRSRCDAGLLDATYLERAKAQRAQTATELYRAQANLKQSQYMIERLLGQEPNSLENILKTSGGELTLPDLPSFTQTTTIDLSVLQHRPDIEATRYELRAAEANVASAEADLWPKITVGAFFGRQVTSSGLTTAPNPIWDVVPAIQMPLFDFGRVRASIDAANARARQALISYEQTVIAAMQEVFTALADYKNGHAAVAQQEAALNFRKSTVALAQDRFQNGISDMIDLTTAQAELDQATITWVQRKAEAAFALIRLFKALGISLPFKAS